MRKGVVLLLIFACLFSLGACSAKEGGSNGYSSQEDNKIDRWGLRVEAQDVTPSGLKLVYYQFGGFGVKELNTGSYYKLHRWDGTEYVPVPYLPEVEDRLAWTMEAFGISKFRITSFDVNWESIYGQLPAGEYRIGKKIRNNGSSDDDDEEMIYAYFEIEP